MCDTASFPPGPFPLSRSLYQLIQVLFKRFRGVVLHFRLVFSPVRVSRTSAFVALGGGLRVL